MARVDKNLNSKKGERMGETVTIYGLKNCDTCRKALKSLEGAVLVDVRETPLPDVLMDQALAQFSGDLLNTRSTTWRGLDAAERERAPRDLLRAYPALMKRPLIRDGSGGLHLGWSAATQAALGI